MITKKEIVATIDNALQYFASLSPSQIATLNTNLGLSNLQLNSMEKPFSEYLDLLVLELIATRDDYANRPVETHWDLSFILRPIEHAVQTMKQMIDKLASAPHEIVFMDTHAALKKIVMFFEHLPGNRSFDPIYVSVIYGKDWTSDVHGDIDDVPALSSNQLIMVNQYLQLLSVMQSRYKFLEQLLRDDFFEIRKVVKWNNQFEAFQELDTELDQQLEILDRVYFNLTPDMEDVDFDTIITFFQDMFFANHFQYRFVEYFRDCDWIGMSRDEQGHETLGSYVDLSGGLGEIRKLHRNYEIWREEFWANR